MSCLKKAPHSRRRLHPNRPVTQPAGMQAARMLWQPI